MPAYDAFLLVSFGGPEGPDDVMPFLENVTRGRGIPPERLVAVAEHYYAVGGVSPINQQCRDMLTAVQADFSAGGLSLPVYWGNRNWPPYLTDTVRAMAEAGVRRAIALVTSAYSSYSSCRQYLDDIERARAAVGPDAPQIDKIRRFFNERGRGAGHACPRGAGGRPPGVHRPQHPSGDGGRQRTRGRAKVCGRAHRGFSPYCRTDRWWQPPVDARLPEQERVAGTALAGT
jgi:hypothetical protein